MHKTVRKTQVHIKIKLSVTKIKIKPNQIKIKNIGLIKISHSKIPTAIKRIHKTIGVGKPQDIF